MIQSNNINVRNLLQKTVLVNKSITASEGFILQRGGAMGEFIVNVTTADPTSYITVIQGNAAHSDEYNPIIYDDKFSRVKTRRFYLNSVGVFKFYVDFQTFDSNSLIITKGNGTPFVTIRTAIYPDKQLIEANLNKDKVMHEITFKGAASVDPEVVNIDTKGYRYAVLEYSVDSGANAASSFWVTGYDKTNASFAMDMYSVDTRERLSTGTASGIVLSNIGTKRVYIDLGGKSIQTINIGRNITDTIIGSVSLVKLTNDIPYSGAIFQEYTPTYLQKQLFSKTFSASEGFTIDKGMMAEFVLNVAVADPTSYVTVIRGGASHSDLYNPIIYDENRNIIDTRRIYLTKTGALRFYADLMAFETTVFVLTKGAGSTLPVVTCRVNVYDNKDILFEKSDKILANININKSTDVEPNIINLNVQGYRYAIIESSISAGANVASSYWVTAFNKSGTSRVMPQFDINTKEIVSSSTGGIVMGINRILRTYVDLGGFGATTINLNTNIVGDLVGSVSIVKLTNENILEKSTTEVAGTNEDILWEDDKIKFVREGKFSDAYNGLVVSNDAYKLFITNDISNLQQRTYDLTSIVNTESSQLNYSIVLPYDPEGLKTIANQRVGVVLKNGIMYVNYFNGGGEGDFGRSTFWECMDTNRKIITNNPDETDPMYRFDPTLTSAHYARNRTKIVDGKTFIEYQGQNVVQWLGPLCRTKKMIAWGHYLGDSRRICFFTSTDGGLNWVVGYDFVRRQTLTVHNAQINTSSFANYLGGLSLKWVGSINPNGTTKEPTSFFTYRDITIDSITTGTSTVVTAPNHQLVDGDIVLFTGTAQDNNWKALLCDEFTDKVIKQNCYSVQLIDTNSFILREYLGSYDFPLQTRHIHSVNDVVDGVVIGCGEYYPQGWMLLYKQDKKDASVVHAIDSFKFPKNNTFRFNSTSFSLQRPCGWTYNSADDPDVVFGSDMAVSSDKNFGNKVMIDGRTETLKKSFAGIWKGKLSQIDDLSKFRNTLSIGEACIWLYQYGEIILCYFMSGANAISYDYGETWRVFPFGTQEFNGIWKNNLVIGGGYVMKWK